MRPVQHRPLGQRGVSLIEMLLGLTVGAGLLVAGIAVYWNATSAAVVADMRTTLVEVAGAVRSARPTGNYLGLSATSTLSATGRFAPARLVAASGAVRGPASTLYTVQVTPDAVLPAQLRSSATGAAKYFDVVVANVPPPHCIAFVRSVERDAIMRLEVNGAVYADRLASPTVAPQTAQLAGATFCRPTGDSTISLRLTFS